MKNVEVYIGRPENSHSKIPSKAETPLMTSYRPELDVSSELTSRDSAYYQSLIGILWWIVELRRIDICLEVSMMSSHLAMPRKGHLYQVLHIFAYLCKYHNTELAGFWVDFAEHYGDSLTHMILDAVTLKIIYRSALRPRTPKDPNKTLVSAGGEEDHQPHENPLNIKIQCQMGRSQLHPIPPLSISNQDMMMVQPLLKSKSKQDRKTDIPTEI